MQRKGAVVAYYITPHGFGHAVRSLEVLRRLAELDPDIKPVIVSDIPRTLVEQNLRRRPAMRRLRLDVGLFQHDGIRFDLAKTLEMLTRLKKDAREIVTGEMKFLAGEQVRLVVSDIAALPFEAAHACGIPAIGIGNFTWDWIYRAYAASDPAWEEIIDWIRRGYGKCPLFLQLPMHGDCSVFSRIIDVPLVARKAERPRSEVRSMLGLSLLEKVVLVSFTGLILDERAFGRLEALENITFIYKSPLEFPLSGARKIDGVDISYADAVAAADAVITKPGYGIVSDCLANGTPIIYTERGLFPEYDVLVETIKSELAAAYLDSTDFREGNWGPAIRQVLTLARKTPDIRADGADVCAKKILELVY